MVKVDRDLNIGNHWMILSDVLRFVFYEGFTGNFPRGLALVQEKGRSERHTRYYNVEQISSVESY